MLFKELRQGYPLYIINSQTAEVGTGTVTSVGQPHVTQDKKKLYNGQLQMVIDVTANFGGSVQTIEVQDNISQTMSNDGLLLITPNKEDVVNGMRMLQTRSEEALRQVQMHQDIKNKCSIWLQNNDPVYQQNAAFEKKLEEMQSIIDKQNSIISQQAADTKEMKEMLAKILKAK